MAGRIGAEQAGKLADRFGSNPRFSIGRTAAHDPPKCEWFGDKIMRFFNLKRDPGAKTGFHFC
jgi:hypothetical protein